MLNKHKRCAVRLELGGRGLVSIDPGARKIGVAVFRPDTRLCRVATVSARHDSKAVAALLNWLGEVDNLAFVCELPVKYPHKRKFHKDIDRLLAFLRNCPWSWDAQFKPREWKSSVGTTHTRGGKLVHHRRLRDALTESELLVMPALGTEPDAWDAVGIGLFALGRVTNGGVLCKGTKP